MNPWKDIASYEFCEAKRFKGREEDIAKFLQMLNGGNCAVLYSESGIGKTSFLNAGVEPVLAKQGYYPIHIRFDEVFKCNITDLEQWLEDKVRGYCMKDISKKAPEVIPDFVWEYEDQNNAEEYINLFSEEARKHFWWFLYGYQLVVDGKEKKPLLIFDQFEEIFVKAKKTNKQKIVEDFFRIIEELASTSMPYQLQSVLEGLYAKNIYLNYDHTHRFKIVFSLRKEYLSEFDYWSNDQYSVTELYQNRMFLLPLTRLQAERVITEQPETRESDKFENAETVKTLSKVCDEIISMADNKRRDEVEPFILSILCSRLYNQAIASGKSQLELEDLENIETEKILSNFYKETIKGIVKASRDIRILEDVLVDEDGHRNRVKVNSKELNVIGFEEKYYELLKDKHLIRPYDINGEDIYIELIHDRIADVVNKHKMERATHRRRNLLWGCTSFLLLLSFWAWIIYNQAVPKEETLREYVPNHVFTSDVLYNIPSGVLYLENDTVYPYAFLGNQDLKVLHIGNNVIIDKYAFQTCDNLEAIYLDGDSIEIYHDAFKNCVGIERIYVSDSCNMDSVSLFCDKERISCIAVDKNKNFLPLPNNLAYINKNADTVIIAGNLSRYPLTLNDISTIGEIDNYRYIIDTISKTIPAESKRGWYAYLYLSQVDSIKQCVPFKVEDVLMPSVSYIGDSAFYSNNVGYVYFPNVITIGRNAFKYCEENLGVEIPNAKYIGDNAFYGNDLLKDVFAPNVEYIGKEAFVYDTSIVVLNFPKASEIMDEAFKFCSKLQSIKMPMADTLGKSLFDGCNELTTIVTSKKVGKMLMDSPSYYGIPFKMEMELQNDSIAVLSKKMCSIRLVDDSTSFGRDSVSEISIKRGVTRLNLIVSDKIEKLRIDLGAPGCFSWNNSIYYYNGNIIYYAVNASEIILMDHPYSLILGKKTERLIHFKPRNIEEVSINNPNGTELIVPYGYLKTCNGSSALKKFKKVSELSLLETYLYKGEYQLRRDINVALSVSYENGQVLLAFLYFVGVLIYGFRLYSKRMQYSFVKSTAYCLLWLVCYIPLTSVYASIREILDVKYHNFAIPAMIAIIFCFSHLLWIGVRKNLYHLKIFGSVSIFVILTILVILFPNMQIGNSVSHCYFIMLIMILLLCELELQNKLVEWEKDNTAVEVYIGYFHPCNMQYAQEIKQIIMDNGVCEQFIYMHTDNYDIEKEKSIISKSKRCFYILSSEALRNNDIRQNVENILLFHLSLLNKFPVYFIPVIYGVKKLDGLLLSKACKRRIMSPIAILSKNKPVLYDKLTKETFVQQIGILAQKKRNTKAFILLMLAVFLYFIIVVTYLCWLSNFLE